MHEQDIEMRRNGSGISSASCFLLGLAIGSAGALLFAPLPGRKLRNLIGDGVTTGGRNIKQQVRQSLEKVTDKVTEVAKEASAIVDSSKKHLTEEGRRIDAALQAGKQAYRSAAGTQEA